MDDYFIKNIPWDRCTNPINAIDFSASTEQLKELEVMLEMIGMPLFRPVVEGVYGSQDKYLTLDIKATHTKLSPCSDRIAPVPTQYIDTLIPALILAHLNDPVSVIQTYNEFFINKKEEITPLLDQ